jgi:hypothetical protein
MGIEDEVRAGMNAFQQKQLTSIQRQEKAARERAERVRKAREEALARAARVAELRPLIFRFLAAAKATGRELERPTIPKPPQQAQGWFLDIRSPNQRQLGDTVRLHEGLNVLLEAIEDPSEPAVWLCTFARALHPSKGWTYSSPWKRRLIGDVNAITELRQVEERLPFALGQRAAGFGFAL